MWRWWLLGVACVIPPDPANQEAEARDAYFRAWCRLYTDPICVRDQVNECEWDRSFRDRTACMDWMMFRVSQCPGANAFFVEHDTEVRACVEQLQAHDCGVEDFCVDKQPTFDADACAPVTEFLTVTCVEESDG